MNDPIYDEVADMMGASLVAGAIPRHVVLRLLRERYPDPAQLRAVTAEVTAHKVKP